MFRQISARSTQSGERSRRVGNKRRADDWSAALLSPDALPRSWGRIQRKLDKSGSFEKDRGAAAEDWPGQKRYGRQLTTAVPSARDACRKSKIAIVAVPVVQRIEREFPKAK